MTRTAWFDSPLPRILAHRGFAVGAPDNSLDAFRAALAAGATHLETDARATADGVAVLMHDETAGVGRALTIARTRAADLAGRAPHVTTLAAALAALPDARFNIDVKAGAAAAPVVRAVVDARAEERVLITSFDSRRRLAALGPLAPVATSASASGVVGALAGIALARPGLVARALRGVDAVQVPERVLGRPTTTSEALDAFHRAGVEVHVWVVNDPVRMRDLVRAGVDGIVTDRPDLAFAALR